MLAGYLMQKERATVSWDARKGLERQAEHARTPQQGTVALTAWKPCLLPGRARAGTSRRQCTFSQALAVTTLSVQGLLPGYWSRNPEGCLQSGSLVLECVPCLRGGDC